VTAILGILSHGVDLQYSEHRLAKSFLSELPGSRPLRPGSVDWAQLIAADFHEGPPSDSIGLTIQNGRGFVGRCKTTGGRMAYLDNALQQLRNERRQAQVQVEKLDPAISALEGLAGSNTPVTWHLV
jgi:hypothetical protein